MAKKKPRRGLSVVKDITLLFGAIKGWIGKSIREALDAVPVMMERAKDLKAANLHLGAFHLAQGHLTDAAYRFRLVNFLSKGDARAWYYLGVCRLCQGRAEEAAQAFEQSLAREPSFRPAAFMREALRDPARVERVPEEVSRDFYDLIAKDYDAIAARRAYDAPLLLFAAAQPFLPAGNLSAMLDLGCGTGLVGEAFAGRALHITGVDVSPVMLAVAEGKTSESGRSAYAALEERSAAAFLASAAPASLDIVTAGHVMHLVRDLEGVMRQVAPVLKPGGLFAFTLRAPVADEAVPDLKGGWFSHGREQAEAAASAAGLTRLHLEETELMLGETGYVAVFGKPAA